jgi:hypothetical protein
MRHLNINFYKKRAPTHHSQLTTCNFNSSASAESKITMVKPDHKFYKETTFYCKMGNINTPEAPQVILCTI